MKTELDKFYGLIEEIKVAMMTTRRPDGHLESRAMPNQKQAGARVEAGETHTLTEPPSVPEPPRTRCCGCSSWSIASGCTPLPWSSVAC